MLKSALPSETSHVTAVDTKLRRGWRNLEASSVDYWPGLKSGLLQEYIQCEYIGVNYQTVYYCVFLIQQITADKK